MKILIHYLIFLFLGVSLVACSQRKETMITQNPSITANNIVEELTKQVKHYSKEPSYFISYGNEMCYFEIFINDILAFKNFHQPLSSSAFEINPYIFKSGSQKLTYKLYSVGKTEYSKTNQTTFGKDTRLSLKITVADNKQRERAGDKNMEFVTPVNISKDEYGNESELFVATGKDYYEGSFTFEAEVPYELEGFDDAQDLRKMDPKELEKKLINEYAVIKNIYQNKEYDNIAKISFYNLKNQFVAKYDDEKYIKDVWKMLMDAYKEPSFEMQPIENQKMVFFADGKLVALMQSTTDNRLRGNTALWAKVNHDGGLRPMFCNRYFYIPKGKTKFEVY
ncbi:hypothetical protein [Flavobacterium sp.]|uniref:hypothetical protein n=1 Tax=Flavobacterium sp. TaxID=239 RepID=UPI0040480640